MCIVSKMGLMISSVVDGGRDAAMMITFKGKNKNWAEWKMCVVVLTVSLAGDDYDYFGGRWIFLFGVRAGCHTVIDLFEYISR